MPYLELDSVKLHYTDSEQWNELEEQHHEPIITIHGLSESHLYWSLPGITDRLIRAGYRVISMDMRGHGFTQVSDAEKGYCIDALMMDITALADHLGLKRFHLLTHATGGIVGLRYAMSHSGRLLSLMATNTGSATYPLDRYAGITDPDYVFPPLSDIDIKRNNALIAGFKGNAWGRVAEVSRSNAARNPFLNRLPKLKHSESAFAMYTACSAIGDPDVMADFVGEFFTDYDPHISGLRKITSPTLMLVGEYDPLFIKPAELVAREVSDCQHVVMKGVGHMTAIEDPAGLSDILLGFLNRVVKKN